MKPRPWSHKPGDENLVTLDGVREYSEGYEVKLGVEDGRPVLVAINEGGYNSTAVDLVDVIAWVRANRPELLG